MWHKTIVAEVVDSMRKQSCFTRLARSRLVDGNDGMYCNYREDRAT